MTVRLRSGSSTPRSAARKRGPASTRRTRTPCPRARSLHHLVPLPAAEQAVVDEDPGDPIPDGPVQEGRRHRGIDSAGQGEQHPARLPHPFADGGDALFDDVGWGPYRRTIADPVHEAAAGSPNPGGYGRPRGGTADRRAAARGARSRRWARSGWTRWCGIRPAGRSPGRRGSSTTSRSPSPARSRCGRRCRAAGPNGRGPRTSAMPNSRASADWTAPPNRTAIACMP